MTPPVLHTRRLRLRAPHTGDFDVLSAFLMSERARHVGGPLSDATQCSRTLGNLAGMWMLRGFGAFVFTQRDDDRALGMAGPWQPMTWPEPEIAWSVWAPEAEGTGLAHEASLAARDHAFRDLGWTTAVSYIDPENVRSIRLAERLGATRDTGATPPPGSGPIHVYRHAPEAA
ncbi:GNAT family N-acetyltransferase [Tranquillimonas rosea]|uniref:GNAT family N-acetyltransferase n=1 Tax=Tranquillimonas rosea TaxID=641238 RepID=UPI003BAB5822